MASTATKGMSVLTGICIFENERLPVPSKPYTKLYDVHFYVPGAPGEELLAALRWYDNAASDIMSDLPGAFFVTAYVTKFAKNRRGLNLTSDQLEPKDYHLAGDIVSLTPIYNWEQSVNPKTPPFIVASGLVDNVAESDAEIVYSMKLDNYLQALDGNGTLPLSVKVDLQSSRWKPVPPDFKRRTPYVKPATYLTVSGLLTGTTTELTTGEVVAFKISASSCTPLGRASAAPPNASDSLGPDGSPLKQKGRADSNSPLKFSFNSLKSSVGGSPRKHRRESSPKAPPVAGPSSTSSTTTT